MKKFLYLFLLISFGVMTNSQVTVNTALSEPNNKKNQSSLNQTNSDVIGEFKGKVFFAQTHVVAAERRIFDPFLVPDREALVLFIPEDDTNSVSILIELNGNTQVFTMKKPEELPSNAIFDKENIFSGEIIQEVWPKFKEKAFSYTLPWNLFNPNVKISFKENNTNRESHLDPAKFIFMTNESEGLVLLNIKGCIFKDQNMCDVTADQFDLQENPLLSKIAAREMFSELPVQRLILGIGQSYWPYIISKGIDGKIHKYTKDNWQQWSTFGDQTLSAKVGMGNYWRAASQLGDKSVGKYVAITGQMIDGPNGMNVMPPGVGASCGGSSCNYPNRLVGYWHETGHGMGLPHSTPPRYEDYAYRSYDNKFLPNYYPNPQINNLPTDYLGFHYFGHVLGVTQGWSEKEAVSKGQPFLWSYFL